ncbi:MAG: hypothetical protein IJJ23_08585, partial [Clostridia bacterium]|nr:hypothetical protein [Clostridia bacterium]
RALFYHPASYHACIGAKERGGKKRASVREVKDVISPSPNVGCPPFRKGKWHMEVIYIYSLPLPF